MDAIVLLLCLIPHDGRRPARRVSVIPCLSVLQCLRTAALLSLTHSHHRLCGPIRGYRSAWGCALMPGKLVCERQKRAVCICDNIELPTLYKALPMSWPDSMSKPDTSTRAWCCVCRSAGMATPTSCVQPALACMTNVPAYWRATRLPCTCLMAMAHTCAVLQ